MREKIPVISVIVPAFNEERRLGHCLAAILSSSIPRYQIQLIVVNNNSTDTTRELALRYADIVLDHCVQGPYHSRNAGAACASSNILAFVDADCIVSPNLLAESLSAAAAGYVAGTCRKVPDIPSLHHRIVWSCYDLVDLIWTRCVDRPYNFFAAFCFVKRLLFETVGGFDSLKGVNADHVFARDLAKFGPIKYIRTSEIVFSVRRLERVGYLTYMLRTKLGRHGSYPHFP